jgi:caspase 7
LKSATACFKSMGFDVHVERNLHYVDLMRLLSRVAVMDHSDSDCLIIVLLSHGNEGTLFAYDAAFPTQRLWEPFVAEKAPTLVGKPKMFFLQACQGNMMDVGVRVVKKQVTQTDSFASYKVS